jgi:NAD(P)-dependent dehydrogenase (short-subunit alcohol dehydrogenase family)
VKTPVFSAKVAAITGAASGIGRALAVALSRRGCALAVADVDESGLAETARLAKEHGVKVTERSLDVTAADDFRAWAAEVVKEHGGVNFIFNNAGVSYGATVQGYEDADFRRVMDVDFWGVVNGTRAFLPHLEASGDGHVINISSIFGVIAFPGQSAYNAAKFAVRGFTECLRMELEITKSPVTATCIHPGGVKTNIAKASKLHASLAKLGVDVESATSRFEEQFRTSADDAAAIILRGVAKNARRVFVGADAHVIDFMQRVLGAGYQSVLISGARRRFKR